MKTKLLLAMLALGATLLPAAAQDNPGPPPGNRGGRPAMQSGFRLLPPRLADQMNLTADQQKQVEALEAEVKAKLEKILTAEQRQLLQPAGTASGQEGSGRRPPQAEGFQPGGRDSAAGNPGGEPGGPNAMGGQRPSSPIIDALDLNKDGTIDADEIAKAAESLKKLDKNGDGKLTTEEYRPQRGGGPGGPGGMGGFGPPGGGRGPGGSGQGWPGGNDLPQRPPMER